MAERSALMARIAASNPRYRETQLHEIVRFFTSNGAEALAERFIIQFAGTKFDMPTHDQVADFRRLASAAAELHGLNDVLQIGKVVKKYKLDAAAFKALHIAAFDRPYQAPPVHAPKETAKAMRAIKLDESFITVLTGMDRRKLV